MHRHMLKYHVGLPLAVFAALVIVGVPVASAFPYALAAGCMSMVFMMFGGGHGQHHRSADHQSHQDSPPRALR